MTVPHALDVWTSTYTGLGRTDLPALLDAMAGVGVRDVEVLAAPPHLDLEDREGSISRLERAARASGIAVRSVVPSGVDVNLASPHAGMRAWSARQFTTVVELAAACGAGFAVVHPGRRHPLRPPPMRHLEEWVSEGLAAVLDVAQDAGVRVLLENVPSGIFDTVAECRELAGRFDGRLGTCVDVANAFMVEDVPGALRGAGSPPDLVHVSDTTRTRWLHDPIGSGEVDWTSVRSALDDIGYDGPVVLETLHPGDGAGGFAQDRARLAAAGWILAP